MANSGHYRGVKDIADSGVSSIPQSFVTPTGERPSPASASDNIPVIDLAQAPAEILKAIKHAGKNWGFFQVINHGVPSMVIEDMFSAALKFHCLPAEEKMKYYSTDSRSNVRYGTNFNDQVLQWRDCLRYHCKPFSNICHLLPDNPPSYRDAVAQYSKHISELGRRILEYISESLGLRADYINRALEPGSEVMASNYYPACPQAELSLGIPKHTDIGAITLLVQDNIGGLQVFHDDTWVAIEPIQNAIVVNLGDQLQILANDIYKSVEHRAVVNSSYARISLPYSFGPGLETIVQPAQELVLQDGCQAYGPYRYGEFLDKVLSGSLGSKKAVLDKFRMLDTR